MTDGDDMGDVREHDVAMARATTRALLLEADPMLHDLQGIISSARALLDRLEEETEADRGRDDGASEDGGSPSE